MDSNLGETIKLARIKKGWSQEKLGQMVGADKASISRYERNIQQPTAEVFLKIIRLLDLQPILFGIDEKKDFITREEFLTAMSRMEAMVSQPKAMST